MNAPTFSGCTDNLGGTDTVTVNSSGWQIAFVSDSGPPPPVGSGTTCPSGTGNDEANNATGDCVVILVPANSTTIQSTASLACGGMITTTPGAAETVAASVTDPGGGTKNTFTLTNQPVPFSCGVVTGTATFNGTYTQQFPNAGALADSS